MIKQYTVYGFAAQHDNALGTMSERVACAHWEQSALMSAKVSALSEEDAERAFENLTGTRALYAEQTRIHGRA